MNTIREYDEKLENIRTFEKIALNYNFEYKGKIHKLLVSCPDISKKIEMNLMLKDQLLKKIEKFFYKLLICSKKEVKLLKMNKICEYIHILYLMGCNNVIINEDYKFIKYDFELAYRLYLI